MKHLKTVVVIALAALAVIPVFAKKNKQEGTPKPVIAEKVYDFGIIKEKGGPVSHDFIIENAGTGNLVVIDATAECGCTRPDYPKNPIAPGKSSKLKVTYNPIGRPGAFEKTVTVKTNGSPRKVSVKVRGTVQPDK